jgi:hypothetical protein
MRVISSAAALAAALAAVPARSQDISAGVELASDEVRRGLSWSEGRPAASADALVSLGAVEGSLRIATLRESARHGGASGVADLELAAAADLGPLRVRGHATGHLFASAGDRMDYAELGASGSYSLGPVQLGVGAIYAPDQDAIGGDNLHLYASAHAGVPATPLSVSAAIGRTSGSVDDPLRAARLRPAGAYTDWRLGAEFSQFPFTLGLDYIGTDIGAQGTASPFADLAGTRDRVVARVRLSF